LKYSTGEFPADDAGIRRSDRAKIMTRFRTMQTKSYAEDRFNQLAPFLSAIFLSVVLSLVFLVSAVFEGNCQPGLFIEEYINPNNASTASLMRLPGIGTDRADRIIAFRSEYLKKQSTKPAFSCPEELQKVKGIGPKTVAQIRKWLKFEAN